MGGEGGGGTKDGRYAVRSGYHLLMNERTQADPGPSDNTELTQLWHTIWSLQVPPKAHHFLWRACHKSLPTRRNLHHRHILDDPNYANCPNRGDGPPCSLAMQNNSLGLAISSMGEETG